MDETFDATAEAKKIQQMAFSCLDDNSHGQSIRAVGTEVALANELASIWGDQGKLTAVASELQQTGPTWGSHQMRVDLGKQAPVDGVDVTGLEFQNVNFAHPDFVMNVKSSEGNVVVTVGNSGRPDFDLRDVKSTASAPIKHEK
jgi:hypothetical protein